MSGPYVLALDQGTTSSRAIVFGRDGRAVASAQQEFPQIFPSPGHVEHDPEAIWSSQLAVAKRARSRRRAPPPADIAAIGITNQRETTVLWDRQTGKPVANAIVWQSRITAPDLRAAQAGRARADVPRPHRAGRGRLFLRHEGQAPARHDPRPARARREGRRALRHRGHVPDLAADRRQAARHRRQQRQPHADVQHPHAGVGRRPAARRSTCRGRCCRRSRSSSEVYGETSPDLFGAPIRLAGDAGDQQAATFGQACFEPGSAKNTYGTGCFMLLNTGREPVPSQERPADHGRLEARRRGDVLPGGLGVHRGRGRAVAARRAQGDRHVRAGRGGARRPCPTPAASTWCRPSSAWGRPTGTPTRAASIVGLERGTTIGHVARAAVESMAYQSRDVLDAMQRDAGIQLGQLKVDGGAAANNELLQFQADLLGVPGAAAGGRRRRRRSARRTWPGSPSATGRTPPTSRATGPSTASSRPRCPPSGGTRSTAAGRRP